jgi:hypothetical protein
MFPDFKLNNHSELTASLKSIGITHFKEACLYIQKIPFGRNNNPKDFSTVLTENKGTCSTKHGFLGKISEEHLQSDIHVMVGIYMMSEKSHPHLKTVFETYNLKFIPETHAYFRVNDVRYDFSSENFSISEIEPFIIREQRCEPLQLIGWKTMIHKHYIESWIKRQNLSYTPEQVWEIREMCLLSESEKSL